MLSLSVGLTKLKTWYLPTEHVNYVIKLVVPHLRIFHNTPCLLPPPPSPTPQESIVKPLFFLFFVFFSFCCYLSCPRRIKGNYANFVMSRNWLFAICASSVIHLVWSLPTKFFMTIGFYFYWVFQFSQEKLKTINMQNLGERVQTRSCIIYDAQIA